MEAKRMFLWIGLLLAACVAAPAPGQGAVQLLGVDWGGMLYDIDPGTGLASHPRDTGIGGVAGIAFSPDGVLYGLNTFDGVVESSLFTIDPATGSTTLVGQVVSNGWWISEGDLGFDPSSGRLFAVGAWGPGEPYLIEADRWTGAASPIAAVPRDWDLSAMAFDSRGRLFALELYGGQLVELDPVTGAVVSAIPLALRGAVGGMALNPADGRFFVADGSTNGTNDLWSLDPDTGALAWIGQTGVPDGLAGLALVPEPAGVLLLCAGALVLSRRRQARAPNIV